MAATAWLTREVRFGTVESPAVAIRPAERGKLPILTLDTSLDFALATHTAAVELHVSRDGGATWEFWCAGTYRGDQLGKAGYRAVGAFLPPDATHARTRLRLAGLHTIGVLGEILDVSPPAAPLDGHHSVARDANTGPIEGVGVTSLTWSHTCSGSDRLLGVGVSLYDPAGDVTGVTYAAAALTKIGERTSASAEAHQWRRLAPATGANDVVVTLGSAQDVAAGAQSFTGVHQTTPLGTQATATGTSTAPSVVVTDSVADDLVWDTLAGNFGTATVGAGQTASWVNSPSDAPSGGGSTEPGAATVTMSWSFASSQEWAICAVAVKQAAAGAAPPQRTLVGVGT